MALEHRGCGIYYYTSRRVGGRVRRVYGGSGVMAQLAAQLDQAQRTARELDAAKQRGVILTLENENAVLRRWCIAADGVVAAALQRSGWHRVRRQWRRRRGAKVSAVATFQELSWVPSELLAQVGTLGPDTVKKAKSKDKAALRVVDQFLDNPAAKLIWGDLGHHVLTRWVRVYAGTNVLMERAMMRFASDLRSKLAGETPTALDVLLAERVVLAWLFTNWSEYQYASLVGQLSSKEHELHLKRIEVANRQFMATVRTLAKVRRVRLPDLLALVNVHPPTDGERVGQSRPPIGVSSSRQ